jgi:hypothetical protein
MVTSPRWGHVPTVLPTRYPVGALTQEMPMYQRFVKLGTYCQLTETCGIAADLERGSSAATGRGTEAIRGVVSAVDRPGGDRKSLSASLDNGQGGRYCPDH